MVYDDRRASAGAKAAASGTAFAFPAADKERLRGIYLGSAKMVTTEHELANLHDEDLERRITSFLFDRGVGALRQIEVQARRGTVELRGQVHSFYHKQLCLSCCRRVAGVVGLVDNIAVLPTA